VTNRFTALKAAQNEVTPEHFWKGTKKLELARETFGSVKLQKKKKWISDATYTAIREKREAKGKDNNRYQELKAEVQRKLRVDKQQQLEGMCVELEAVNSNSKGNYRQLFQIVKSMTQKFQPCLQCIQSATGENLTEAAQIADRWKGYCEDLYCDEEGKGIEQEYWEQEPPPLCSEVARVIHQRASRKTTGPDEVPAELFKA